jgi:hypothetical protein
VTADIAYVDVLVVLICTRGEVARGRRAEPPMPRVARAPQYTVIIHNTILKSRSETYIYTYTQEVRNSAIVTVLRPRWDGMRCLYRCPRTDAAATQKQGNSLIYHVH